MIRTLSYSLLAACLLTGCAPGRQIRMINLTDAPAMVRLEIKEDSIHQSPFYMYNATEVRFPLRAGRGPAIRLSMGPGQWTPSAIKALADDLEHFTLESRTGTIELKDAEAITAFLLPRRRGIGHKRIELVFRD